MIMDMIENKENIRPFSLSDCKEGIKGKSNNRKTFGKLLQDATNQKRVEEDGAFASNVQNEEAYQVILQWKREESDSKLASQLDEAIQEEDRVQRSLMLAQDKEQALKIAVEERKRVLQEKKEREELEKMDFEFAKKFSMEDAASLSEMQKLFEEDEKLVKKLYGEFQDYPMDKEAEVKSDVDHRLVKDDFEIAQKFQRDVDKDNQLSKSNQEIADFRLSRRLLIKSSREQHRISQRTKVMAKLSPSTNASILSSSAAARLWEEAEATVENVCGGICITILLPQILKLKVSRYRSSMVRIEATRLVDKKTDKLADSYNSQFVADFNIQGRDVHLSDCDLSYDYSSEVGLLHVYVENVSLDGPMDEKESQGEPIPIRRGIIRSLKSSYQSLFRK